jgi:hypothetical protein
VPRTIEHLPMAALIKRLLAIAGIAATVGIVPLLAEGGALVLRGGLASISLVSASATASLVVGSDRIRLPWKLEEQRAGRLLQRTAPQVPTGQSLSRILLANR